MLNFILCDDNIDYVDKLYKLVNEMRPNASIIHKYYSGEKLLNSLDKIAENTIFIMDIILNDASGIDIAKKINEQAKNAVIIFISGYLEKATEVYDTVHCYFIYKPDMENRLPLAIAKAEKQINENRKKLVIQLKEKKVFINVANIHYLERIKRTTHIYEKQKHYECSFDLNYFNNQLLDYFIRCHRSFIVNLNEVKEFKRTEFLLNDGTIVPISRSYYPDVNRKFQNYLINRLK